MEQGAATASRVVSLGPRSGPGFGRTCAVGVLFGVGFLLGLTLFAPWDKLWDVGLRAASGAMRGLSLSWSEVSEATMFGCRVRDLRVALPQGRFSLPEVEARLGLLTPLTLDVRTGPSLRMALGYDKVLTLDGGLDAAALDLDRPVQGRVDVSGAFGFASLPGPPTSGRLEAKSSSLTLPNGLTVQDISLAASLAGSRLSIESFRSVKPAPVELQGGIELSWSNLVSSSVNVSGSAMLAGQKQTFQRSGRLAAVISGL